MPTRTGAPLLLLAVFMTGAAAQEGPKLVPVATDRPLRAPVAAALGPHHEVIVLASEGEGKPFAIYRSDTLGTQWERWALLPGAVGTEIDLAVTPRAVLAAGAAPAVGSDTARAIPGAIWVASLPLDAPVPADDRVRRTELSTATRVLALTLDASPTLPDSVACAHLAYLMQAADTSGQRIEYRRSVDEGLSWSEPQTMAQGALGPPALFARSESPPVVDLCFARDGFMHWCGANHYGTRWGSDRPVRLALSPSGRTGVAREGRDAILICESETHQVVGAPSRNGGVNWERAVAIARSSDRPRRPSIDYRGGRFWVVYSQGDSLVVARWAKDPSYPTRWSPPLVVARARCLGAPAVVALPESSAVVVFAAPEGKVYAARISGRGP